MKPRRVALIAAWLGAVAVGPGTAQNNAALAGPRGGPTEPATTMAAPGTGIPLPPFPPPGPDSAAVDTGMAAALERLDQIRQRDRRAGFEYKADTLVVYGDGGDSILICGHPAEVRHHETVLTAAEMIYRRAAEVVEAQGGVDSTGAVRDTPELKRGEEVLRGERIVYDLKREQGAVVQGRVRRDRAFIVGQRIVAVSDREFRVARGSYTTCDLEHPHFDFFSPRIKVIPGELAVARPVYLRVGGVPLLWVPFYVFPLRQDRQSGLLTPSFGRRALRYGSSASEWEIRNLGYYLAPSPYWDLTLSADLRQQSGWLAQGTLVHARRYRWNGRITAQWENRQDGSTVSRAWRLEAQHSQEISPTTQLRGSGTLQSNRTFGQDNSTNLLDRLNRTLRSNLSLNKRWPRSGNTLSVSASQTRNLDTRTADMVLPELSLRRARQAVFGRPATAAWGTDAATAPTSSSDAWYRQLYLDTGLRLRHAARSTAYDTSTTTSADLDLRLSSQHKPLPWLQLSPSLSETWQDADLGSRRIASRRNDQFSATATLTQTLYGLFQPHWGQLAAVRHVAKPNVALSWQAARSDTGGVLGFGGAAGDWQQHRRLDLRLDNTIWAKVERGEEESKIRLAQVDFSSSYDLDAKVRPLADLVTAVSVAAGQRLDTRLTVRSEFYDDLNQFHLAPRRRQLEVRTQLQWSRASRGNAGTGTVAGTFSGFDAYRGSQGSYLAGMASPSAATAPGSLQLVHYYTQTRPGGPRSWVRLATNLGLGRTLVSGSPQPQPRWRVDYSINYNLYSPSNPLLARARITSELLSIQREFHDWTASLSLEPNRLDRGRVFYFKAQLRDLPQIRLERGDARL